MALRIRAQKEIVAAVQLEATPAPLTPTQKHAKAYDEGMRLLQPQF
jgi:hypothetical protein